METTTKKKTSRPARGVADDGQPGAPAHEDRERHLEQRDERDEDVEERRGGLVHLLVGAEDEGGREEASAEDDLALREGLGRLGLAGGPGAAGEEGGAVAAAAGDGRWRREGLAVVVGVVAAVDEAASGGVGGVAALVVGGGSGGRGVSPAPSPDAPGARSGSPAADGGRGSGLMSTAARTVPAQACNE